MSVAARQRMHSRSVCGPARCRTRLPRPRCCCAAATPNNAVVAAEAGGDVAWPSPGEPFWRRPPRVVARPSDKVGHGLGLAEAPCASPLRVAHLAFELAPWAKVGGLADAVSGLALACRAAGHDVLVLLPFYSELDTAELVGLAHERDFDAPVGALRDDGELVVTWRRHTAHTAAVAGVPCVLLRPAADSPFGRPYAYRGDEPSAAVAWCRCALEWLAQSGRRVHILHAHEWQAGAACMLYWELGYRGRLGAGVVLTIHNADSAGECRADQFVSCGARPAAFMTPDRALDERTRGHNPERMCLLKGGVVFAQAVTTVSRTYRDECVRAGWLGATLAAAGPKFVGITNGMDATLWDPRWDGVLPAPFGPGDLAGKRTAKRYLQRGLGLRCEADAPLVAAVTRLVPQKGVDALLAAARGALADGGGGGYQFVLLGTGPSDGPFRDLAASPAASGPDSPLRLLLMFDEPLSRLIFAAADIILVPSVWEPCGLSQLIGQRYGALPLVRRTGGLADTVRHGVDGFAYDAPGEFEAALGAALRVYRDEPGRWAALRDAALAVDSSWAKPAAEYVDTYRRVAGPG